MQCGCERLCTSEIKLFSSFPIELQYEIAKTAVHTKRKKSEIIIGEGDESKSIFLIREGRVKLSKFDSSGKEYIQDIVVQGESIGEDMFLSHEPFPYSIICVTNVSLCEIKREEFMKLIKENPSASINLMDSMTEKLRRANDKNLILQENDAMKRLAEFLLDRYERTNGNIKLTIDDIAASINLRRETVSRKIQTLVQEEFIERIGQSEIRILRKEDLKNI